MPMPKLLHSWDSTCPQPVSWQVITGRISRESRGIPALKTRLCRSEFSGSPGRLAVRPRTSLRVAFRPPPQSCEWIVVDFVSRATAIDRHFAAPAVVTVSQRLRFLRRQQMQPRLEISASAGSSCADQSSLCERNCVVVGRRSRVTNGWPCAQTSYEKVGGGASSVARKQRAQGASAGRVARERGRTSEK